MYSTDILIKTVNREFDGEETLNDVWHQNCGLFILEDIFTTDTVFAAACHASRGFMHKKDTFSFMQNPWLNSWKLKEDVLTGKFRPKYYPQKIINERGKQRVIKPPTFECKVVQKVICDYIIRPLFEPEMIQTSYASVKGRGTHQMYLDIEKELNTGRKDGYSIVMGDYRNYFGNIDTRYLIDGLMADKIKDPRVVALIRLFSPEEKGLSIGNELSQIPASYLPSEFDHFVTEGLQYPYFRFMDDSLAIVPKGKVPEYISLYKNYADHMHCVTSNEKIRTVSFGKPFSFCKELFLWDKNREKYYTLPNPKLEANERRKLKKMVQKVKYGEITPDKVEEQYASVRGGLTRRPNTKKIVMRLDEEAGK